MRKSKFSESQIAEILKEAEAGLAVAEAARKHGISAATFYQWRSKYGGMSVSDMQRLRELEQENARLKRMYANLSLEHEPLREVAVKSGDASSAPRGGGLAVGREVGERAPGVPGRATAVRDAASSATVDRAVGGRDAIARTGAGARGCRATRRARRLRRVSRNLWTHCAG